MEPLVLGLTGPIASGCTTIGEMLERLGRQPFKEFIEGTPLSDSANRSRIHDLDLKMRVVDSPEEAQHLLRMLKESLRERAVLNGLDNSPFGFRRISMSSLLAKLCFDCLRDADEWAGTNRVRRAFLGLLKDRSPLVSGALDVLNGFTPGVKVSKTDYRKVRSVISLLGSTVKVLKRAERKALAAGETEIYILQELGNNTRLSGNPFSEVAKGDNRACLAVEGAKTIEFFTTYGETDPDTGHRGHFVIDALRNPSEVEYFRSVFTGFYLVSVNASEETRRRRFTEDSLQNFTQDGPTAGKKRSAEQVFAKVDRQDQGDSSFPKDSHTQNVSECAYLADISINNDCDSIRDPELLRKLVRYLSLITMPGCTQPTSDETMMHLAYGLSLRSTCISRQVGAVITDSEGYVLGEGWNDCAHGQVGCGLLTRRDYLPPNDLFALEPYREIIEDVVDLRTVHFCFKDMMSRREALRKLDELSRKDPNLPLLEEAQVGIAQGLGIKRLEYCRALHAEENALLQAARNGGRGVKGGTIFTTTFPCELCAKKIRQAGISRIVYTEPYPGAISERIFLREGVGAPSVEQFEGVKSSAYFRLFKPRISPKDREAALAEREHQSEGPGETHSVKPMDG